MEYPNFKELFEKYGTQLNMREETKDNRKYYYIKTNGNGEIKICENTAHSILRHKYTELNKNKPNNLEETINSSNNS